MNFLANNVAMFVLAAYIIALVGIRQEGNTL